MMKIIDDQDFPDLTVCEPVVKKLLERMSDHELIALYVFMEGTDHETFNLVSEAVYKISGHEEPDELDLRELKSFRHE